ncbi:MAG TPA: hypothetical protein PLX89_00030 [Verrucomicrobiota bacterium]|nr:hypothetical protein [Verrucomicrobiota bacterium]
MSSMRFLSALAGPLDPPILTSGIAAVFDFDEDEAADFDYFYSASRLGGSQEEFYRVGLSLRSFGSGRCLRALASRIPFETGEPVSSDSPEVLSEGGSNWLGLGGYDVGRALPGAEWRYIERNFPGAFWRNRLEVLIGFRFAQEDGMHHGWFRFTRPDTHFTTAFELTEYSWNPAPGEPIAAGVPPSLLRYEVIEERLRLSWPAEAAGWILESASPLADETYWEEVSGAGATEVILPLGEATRYFRLRRP